MAEIADIVTQRCQKLATQLAGISTDSYIREAIMRLALQELAVACHDTLGVRNFEIADHLRYLAERLEAGEELAPTKLDAAALAD